MEGEKIRQLISHNRISEAIDALQKNLLANDELGNSLVLLKNRWYINRDDFQKGLISNEDYSLRSNMLISDLLLLISEYEFKYNNSKSGVLILKGETSNIPNIIELFDSLNKIYQGFVFIESLKDRPSRDKDFIIKISSNFNPNNHNLDLYKAHFSSPGIWEFLGSINPLEQLRQFLNDQFDRKMKREFLELDKEEKKLKNLAIRNNIIKSQIEVLKVAGFGENEIKDLMLTHFINPMKGLENAIEKGLIESSEMKMKN